MYHLRKLKYKYNVRIKHNVNMSCISCLSKFNKYTRIKMQMFLIYAIYDVELKIKILFPNLCKFT